jgi:hypothetical protein
MADEEWDGVDRKGRPLGGKLHRRDTGRTLFEELNARYKEASYMMRASDGLRQGDWRPSKGSRWIERGDHFLRRGGNRQAE